MFQNYCENTSHHASFYTNLTNKDLPEYYDKSEIINYYDVNLTEHSIVKGIIKHDDKNKRPKDKPTRILLERYDLYNTLAIVHEIEDQKILVSHT